MDRGLLENDLRNMVVDDGATLFDGAKVVDLQIASDAHADHAATIENTDTGERTVLSGRWLIDASGRTRLLQRRLGLGRKTDSNCSAVWFRVRGRLDVSDFVPATDAAWHARVSTSHPRHDDFGRYNSTNHLMDNGYWVWLIPLPTDSTSVGIVADEKVIEFDRFNKLEKALDWIGENETALAERLDRDAILDFRSMRNYTYSADQVFSAQRWACTGEAGVFTDPWQSPGTHAISISNCIITELIERDRREALDEEMAKRVNREYLRYAQATTRIIHAGYPYFGDRVISGAVVVWYLAWAMSSIVPSFRFVYFRERTLADTGGFDDETWSLVSSIHDLGERMAAFLASWGAQRASSGLTNGYDWLDYWKIPFFAAFRDRMLHQDAPQWEDNMSKLRTLAAGIALAALRDVRPEVRAGIPDNAIPDVDNLPSHVDEWDGWSMVESEAFGEAREIEESFVESFQLTLSVTSARAR